MIGALQSFPFFVGEFTLRNEEETMRPVGLISNPNDISTAGRCVVAKVLKFDRQNGVPRKVKSEPDEPRGKVIEFPRQELMNNLESAEIGKTDETNAAAVFFGCF